ncbi:MAG: hypothetical protein U0526_00040 [Candidatus Saccharibacteria bacterium]
MNNLDRMLALVKANLVVTNVQYDAVGKQPYLAPPGLKFAIATVTITTPHRNGLILPLSCKRKSLMKRAKSGRCRQQ